MRALFGREPGSLSSHPSLPLWLEVLEPWQEESCEAFASLNPGVLEDH